MVNIVSYFRAHKHRLATVALIFGFFVDLITFRNLNLTYALFLLSAHLFIVAFTMLILSVPFRRRDSFFTKVREWLPVLQQYSTGNLLSAFLILYSASGSLAASWPFLALVALAAIGNETLKLEKYRLPFHTSLFFLNLILFSALASPILSRSISAATFLLSIFVASIIFFLFQKILRLASCAALYEHGSRITRGAALIIVLTSALYFTNTIPPIPLTLKNADFYYSVERAGDEYRARDEARTRFEKYVSFSPKKLRLTSGDDAYLYTAVFIPARLGTTVVHRWQYWSEKADAWVTKNTVQFPIAGGRAAGYRGFSLTENPTPGRWRVSVETARGQTLGRIYLFVERAAQAPLLQSERL